MEELFVYSLLYSVEYEKINDYGKALDSLFLKHPEDGDLLDLEEKSFKDAMLHLQHLLHVRSFDPVKFGKYLADALNPIYEASDIAHFGKKMYHLWTLLPEEISREDPFHILSYADDCLSYGDEKQCRTLYERFLNYYNES